MNRSLTCLIHTAKQILTPQCVCFLLPLFFVIFSSSLSFASVKDAVVKIYTVSNAYNYHEPWQMMGQKSNNGSGFIIEGNRILTNAHVVAWSTFVQVRRSGEAKKYTAKVEVVAHECDLAVLSVEDKGFFSGITPLKIASLPELSDEVTVYGFPAGGDKLSLTKGVVSRIEHIIYSHSGAYLLAGQIDASINSGSSGGPVLKDDKVVGVAFQGMLRSGFENVGYIIPAPVVKHFLQDIEDGIYDGTPELGIFMQKMENPALRQRYGMLNDETGVLVTRVYPDSPTKNIAFDSDVILKVDGITVENDGTVEFRKGERTFLGHLIQTKHINDTVALDILRNNQRIKVEVKLTKAIGCDRLVPNMRYDVPPTYFVYGGLVFTPLVLNYLKEYGDDNDWSVRAPSNLLHYYFNEEPQEDRRSIVIITKVLADEINIGYHSYQDGVVIKINGRRISTIKDVLTAIYGHTGQFIEIEDTKGHRLVLDKQIASEANSKILKRYKIAADRSQDL